jgi:phenylacetate-CoA ligase
MSETLSDSLREKLSCVFNADIIGHYGSEELGTLAFECKEHAGYHIIADNVIIEIEKDSNKVASSDIGEVIVTNLNNFTMPLIRYKLGDIAVLSGEKCKCGRGLPLIKQIVGREDDFIILPSGRKISPRMINAIENISGIISYKTIQESKNRILVQLVKGNEFSDSTIPEVKKQIKLGCLGEQIEINVKLVKEIPKSDRGKIRAIVSNLDKN